MALREFEFVGGSLDGQKLKEEADKVGAFGLQGHLLGYTDPASGDTYEVDFFMGKEVLLYKGNEGRAGRSDQNANS